MNLESKTAFYDPGRWVLVAEGFQRRPWRALASIFLASLEVACGSSSPITCPDGQVPVKQSALQRVLKRPTCLPHSADERAMIALNQGDYETAITILDPLVAAAPQEYFRLPRLATAYAGRGGVILLAAVQKLQAGSSGGAGSSSPLAAIIPSYDSHRRAAYKAKIADVSHARDLLVARMPASLRSANSPNLFGASAALQLFIYRTSSSLMLLKTFVVPTGIGNSKPDPAILSSLSPADASTIIGNLQASVNDSKNGTGGGLGPTTAAAVQNILNVIYAQPGANQAEQLQSYLATYGTGLPPAGAPSSSTEKVSSSSP